MTFDFVWCAGVIHHTSSFEGALNELTRVLKSGGMIFLLIYGTGGLRWKLIKALRPIVVDLGQEFIDKAMSVAEFPANNRKHFMDDLFVPIQKLTSLSEITSELHKRGFDDINRWSGETYDHESNPKTILEDIIKLATLTKGCVGLSNTNMQKNLSGLAVAVCTLYIETCRKVLLDKCISPSEIRSIVIGEGNHRIVARKL
jgi:SAM-dependent methyltransferase